MPIDKISAFPGQQPQHTTENSQVQVRRGEPTSAQQESGRSQTHDTVTLTDTSERLQRLENTIASLPVEDSQRVESIRRAIVDGSYQVDSEKVAGKMIALESQIFGEGDKS